MADAIIDWRERQFLDHRRDFPNDPTGLPVARRTAFLFSSPTERDGDLATLLEAPTQTADAAQRDEWNKLLTGGLDVGLGLTLLEVDLLNEGRTVTTSKFHPVENKIGRYNLLHLARVVPEVHNELYDCLSKTLFGYADRPYIVFCSEEKDEKKLLVGYSTSSNITYFVFIDKLTETVIGRFGLRVQNLEQLKTEGMARGGAIPGEIERQFTDWACYSKPPAGFRELFQRYDLENDLLRSWRTPSLRVYSTQIDHERRLLVAYVTTGQRDSYFFLDPTPSKQGKR